MFRYFFEISYNGKNYHGWQIQPNALSVQEEIQKALSKLNGNETIEIVGCGRTDAGVHANHYIFHADYSNEIKLDLNQLKYKLNKILSDDISIHSVSSVSNELHARFSATERMYRYYFHSIKNPFSYSTSWYYNHELDFIKMNLACKFLIGKQDFTSFSKTNTDVKTNICTIFSAKWQNNKDGTFYFEISADRFLRNMVRAIVGTLIEVGKQNIEPEEIKAIISKKDRGAAAVSVPAHGLYLWKVKY